MATLTSAESTKVYPSPEIQPTESYAAPPLGALGSSRPGAGARPQERAQRLRRARARAALRAAAERPRGPFVRAAFFAAADRAAAPRRCAAVLAWRASADLEAARRPSRFKAPRVARER